ncbi:hypothetical protein BDZ89DRAFT_1152663 [Hymenopellis radicata]|nr:hypothetical protein BDZ89DRAFT_1152663 [Hymenopellis radicata]
MTPAWAIAMRTWDGGVNFTKPESQLKRSTRFAGDLEMTAPRKYQCEVMTPLVSECIRSRSTPPRAYFGDSGLRDSFSRVGATVSAARLKYRRAPGIQFDLGMIIKFPLVFLVGTRQRNSLTILRPSLLRFARETRTTSVLLVDGGIVSSV